ncbi:MAG: glycosyl transferase [Lachnospiraceae bacterium]|nr:glycosyl transferase [Lachnospiraceae bacterium]
MIKKNREVIYMLMSLLRFIPDRIYLKILYGIKVGKKLNLHNPQTFSEKIQWLKLYDRNPEYTILVDKYEVKKYVADKIGEKYIIPTLGVWNKFEDIDFDLLPDQFVLKCTHDSGGLVICKDKSKLDIKKIRKKMTRSLRNNYYYIFREWPYKNVKPKIIAEKYMAERGKIVPEDYKVYCMNGMPRYIVVFHNRFSKNGQLSETVYDTNWIPQNFSLNGHFSISNIVQPRPECLDELLNICTILCQGISQVRIDFYIIENNIFFGEITLYAASGLQKMIPADMDRIIGEMVQIPIKDSKKTLV